MRKVALALLAFLGLLAQSSFADAQQPGCTVYSIAVGCYVYPQGLLQIPQTMAPGSVTAPAVAFQTAPSTGLFLNATNLSELDFAASGGLVGNFNQYGLHGVIGGGNAPAAGTFTVLTANAEMREPVWQTVSRPPNPVIGEFGWNTNYNAAEFWNGSAWVQITLSNNAGIHGASALSWGSPVTVTAGTYIVMASWPWNSGTIQTVVGVVGAGGQSFTVNLQINGVSLTGCNAIVVNSATNVTTTCTSSNVIASGQTLTAIISSVTGAPNMAVAQINYIHSEP